MQNPLAVYLKRHGLSQARFARAHGWRQATISGWCNDVVPSIPLALALEQATGGDVTVNDWASYAKANDKAFGDSALPAASTLPSSALGAGLGVNNTPSRNAKQAERVDTRDACGGGDTEGAA